MHTLASRLFTASLTALLLHAAPASANNLENTEDFAYSAEVPDRELATMRGGFAGFNGPMIDFSFLSRITQKLPDDTIRVLQDASFNSRDLGQKIADQTQKMINDTMAAAQMPSTSQTNPNAATQAAAAQQALQAANGAIQQAAAAQQQAAAASNAPQSFTIPVMDLPTNLPNAVIENTLSNTIINVQRVFEINVMASDLVAASQMNARLNSVAFQNTAALHGL